jgi:hypothetical protein
MNGNWLKLTFFIILLSAACYGQSPWLAVKNRNAVALKGRLADNATYTLYTLDQAELLTQLKQKGTDQYLALPTPDGSLRNFRIWRSQLLPAALAAKYPDIATYSGVATDNATVTVKIDNSNDGFHAMVFDGSKTYLVDPTEKISNGLYLVHYKNDELKKYDAAGCQLINSISNAIAPTAATALKVVNGYQLRTYRIAIGCSHQYAQAAVGTETPTKNQALAKIITSLNRVNGIYERELSITMKLVDKEDTIIFVKEAGDPYGAANSSTVALLPINQQVCDTLIGIDNYDLGHVFCTADGGVSAPGVVCSFNGDRAQSATGRPDPTGDGFDIDYVTHEIGHEFGASHTFNGSIGACGSGNGVAESAYEPGSGSTLMAYAGICGLDNLQPHSDDYFHAKTLLQINDFVTHLPATCGIKTTTGNKTPYLPGFTASYAIPYLTPFELTAPAAVDSVADSVTNYCWEQWNLGDFTRTFTATHYYGPIFRSFSPDTSRTRIFPRIDMVLTGQKSDAGNENAQGEKSPDVARFLTFKLTVRNILNGFGCFQFPDDSIHLDAINTGAPFEVTSQNNPNIKYLAGTKQNVTWNVVTSNLPPIGADSVNIYLSLDGGYTWPYKLGTYPNTGGATVTIPEIAATTAKARIKVKGAGNVFFNINGADFFIVTDPGAAGDIVLFPIPARNTVTIVTGEKGLVDFAIYDMSGKRMVYGTIDGIADLDVSSWPRAVYAARMQEPDGHTTVRKFVLE